MDTIKIDVKTILIGNNPAPRQLENAIYEALTEQQIDLLYNSDLYRDVEVTYSQSAGWPGNQFVFNTYVEDLIADID